MGELERARSVFERAIGVNHKHISVWVRYAEMEMRHRFVNRARNVWDRAVTLLPRVDQLWEPTVSYLNRKKDTKRKHTTSHLTVYLLEGTYNIYSVKRHIEVFNLFKRTEIGGLCPFP